MPKSLAVMARLEKAWCMGEVESNSQFGVDMLQELEVVTTRCLLKQVLGALMTCAAG